MVSSISFFSVEVVITPIEGNAGGGFSVSSTSTTFSASAISSRSVPAITVEVDGSVETKRSPLSTSVV